jgi:stearoyl-CoA desaturase (delta-9 desaturase)
LTTTSAPIVSTPGAAAPIVRRDGVNWITVIAFGAFHIGAVAALFFFRWPAFFSAIGLYWLSLSLGIGMGYHRLLTHRGYKVPRYVEYFLALCGTLALEGGPIAWVATHRVHHQFSDHDGDPHTPRDGRWWAHILWMLVGDPSNADTPTCARYAPDLMKDPFYRWLNRFHWVPLTAVGLLLLAIGGIPFVLWGIFLRVTVGQHVTWMVNSITHIWGSRRFATRDDSRNNWFVALLSFGEGWHNNHHAHPTSARHGLAWYELDITYLTIRLCQLLGLAKSVKAARLATASRGAVVTRQAA